MPATNGYANGTAHTIEPESLLSLVANASDRELIALSSIFGSRAALAAQLGKAFGGKRDYFDALGYPKQLDDTHLLQKYLRDPLARRAVNLIAGRTFQDMPQLTTSGKGATFNAAVLALADRFSWMDYCRRVDCLSSLGRFALLFIGTKGTAALDQPQEQLSSVDDILYLAAYHKSHITNVKYGDNPRDARYRLPIQYEIQLGNTIDDESQIASTQAHWVHWTRVIHVAQDTLIDDVHGLPFLEAIYNTLEDILKVTGASAEATWRLVYQGMTIEANDGVGFDEDIVTQLRERAEAYLHGFNRVMALQGAKATINGGATVDPSGMWDVLKEILAAGSGIPSRILFGSERGELASSQDEANFAGTIDGRRNTFAEPRILRPLIDWHIRYGALTPPPGNGRYLITWKPAFELNQKEQAELTNIRAEALAKLKALAPILSPELVKAAGFGDELAAVMTQPPPDEIEPEEAAETESEVDE